MPELNESALRGGRDSQSWPFSQRLFSRPMPGGGSVRVELLVSDRGDVARERLRGRVVMDHAAQCDSTLIVQEIEGDDLDQVVPELLRIARDNAAIARRVMRRPTDG